MRLVIAATIFIAASASLTGCATKRYAIAQPLSQTEARLMTCRELAIEAERIEALRAQIADTARVDWRSLAAFANDFGIGNAMARSEAESAMRERAEAVQAAQATRQCDGPNEPVPAS